MRFYESVFSAAPLDITHASLGAAAFAIPLQDIFSGHSELHKKWQNFYKAIFCWTCELVYTHRIQQRDIKRLPCFQAWRTISHCHQLSTLNLGGLKDIPVNWGGPDECLETSRLETGYCRTKVSSTFFFICRSCIAS